MPELRRLASMRPEQFSSGNLCSNLQRTRLHRASMRPEQFSSGNLRFSGATLAWSNRFNEAGAIQLRKSSNPRCPAAQRIPCFNEAGAIQLRKSVPLPSFAAPVSVGLFARPNQSEVRLSKHFAMNPSFISTFSIFSKTLHACERWRGFSCHRSPRMHPAKKSHYDRVLLNGIKRPAHAFDTQLNRVRRPQVDD